MVTSPHAEPGLQRCVVQPQEPDWAHRLFDTPALKLLASEQKRNLLSLCRTQFWKVKYAVRVGDLFNLGCCLNSCQDWHMVFFTTYWHERGEEKDVIRRSENVAA